MKNKNALLIILIAILIGSAFYCRNIVRREIAGWFFSRGSHYFGQNAYNLKSAEKFYELALTFDSRLPNTHYQLARIHFVNSDFSGALAEIDKEISLNPQNQRSYYIRGLINGFSGNFGEAINDFAKFIAWEPKAWAGYTDLAWVYYEAGEYQRAKDIVLKGLAIDSSNPWLLNGLGEADRGLKDYSGAQEAFSNALLAAKKLSVNDWQRAYPGNNPAEAGKNLEKFKSDILSNLILASNNLEGKGVFVSACRPSLYSYCSGCSCQAYLCDPDHESCSSSCFSSDDCCPPPPPAPVVNITATGHGVTSDTQVQIAEGESVNLNWTQTGGTATGCTGSGGSVGWPSSPLGAYDKPSQDQTASYTYSPTEGIYTYTIQCTGSGGTSSQGSVLVDVIKPVLTVAVGTKNCSSVNLSWAWNDPWFNSQFAQYRVLRSEDGIAFSQRAIVNASPYQDQDVFTSDGTYYYKIEALRPPLSPVTSQNTVQTVPCPSLPDWQEVIPRL